MYASSRAVEGNVERYHVIQVTGRYLAGAPLLIALAVIGTGSCVPGVKLPTTTLLFELFVISIDCNPVHAAQEVTVMVVVPDPLTVKAVRSPVIWVMTRLQFGFLVRGCRRDSACRFTYAHYAQSYDQDCKAEHAREVDSFHKAPFGVQE